MHPKQRQKKTEQKTKKQKKEEEKNMQQDNTEPSYVIAIDPDNQESGIGVVDRTSRQCFTLKMNFAELMYWLARVEDNYGKDTKVVIEGGWLNKSNWHILGRYMSTQKAAAIGRSAGMNHQTGILIEQMCRYMGVNTTVVKPLKKCWKGKDGKITQKEAEYFMGKLPRMNQDQRDALLLAWVYAGLPVKIAPAKPAEKANGRNVTKS